MNGNNKLAEAKTNAKNTIDGLTYLNDAQCAKAKENVEHATTRSNITSQLQDYANLNNAMKSLRESVNNVNHIKASSNYINEDNESKKHIKSSCNKCSDINKCIKQSCYERKHCK